MKLNAKNLYALKAVLELSLRYSREKRVIRLGEISKRQNIPNKFLVQILLRLKKAGLIQAERGMAGGYYLARHPSQIKMADVLQAVDASVLELSGLRAKSEAEKMLSSVWEKLNQDIRNHLETSFEDLTKRLESAPLNYHI